MGKEETKELFIAFLKEKKVFRQFQDNLKKSELSHCSTIDEFVQFTAKEREGILCSNSAFYWADTEEGFHFWNKFDIEWRKYYVTMSKKYPKIISVTYSMKLNEEIIREIIFSDLVIKNEPIHKILERRKEIKSVRYPRGIKRDSIEITILTDSINDPKKNHKYWQSIANEINEHIEEEVNEIQ